jgi:hypothetical protein
MITKAMIAFMVMRLQVNFMRPLKIVISKSSPGLSGTGGLFDLGIVGTFYCSPLCPGRRSKTIGLLIRKLLSFF